MSISLNLICNFFDLDKILKVKKINKFITDNKLKIYLCKDFFINKANIKKIYPDFNRFLRNKKKFDKKNIFFSDFLKRVS